MHTYVTCVGVRKLSHPALQLLQFHFVTVVVRLETRLVSIVSNTNIYRLYRKDGPNHRDVTTH